MYEKFLANGYPKFHVMQISRKFLGKLDTLSKYNPQDFFDLSNDEKLLKAISD